MWLSIDKRIDLCAATTPERTALLSATHRISYGELTHRTNQIAHWLRKRGAGPGAIIGISMPRSLGSALAILATLKSGAAYVYLDPQHPPEYLRHVIEDAGPLLILGDSKATNLAVGPPVLVFDDIDYSREATQAPDRATAPRSAACILYTSGSTGKPKGVIQVHGSLVARLAGTLPDIQGNDVCALTSSFGFGITISRLCLPLSLGSSVVILDDADVRDVQRFVETLQVFGVTSVFLSPALLRAVLDSGARGGASLASLRVVTVTGAMLTSSLLPQFFGLLRQTLLVNIYGSAEIGTAATVRVFDKSFDGGRVTIGRPVVNTDLYVLDEGMRHVEDGEQGEICVGAPHLSLGYQNLPELTAERFVADPFKPGATMFRTGDFGLVLPNGEIELTGRRDQQVKIRGVRVELAQAESALERHPQVREAVVLAQGEETRLIAYIQIRDEAPRVAHLRAWLSREVPPFLVPSAFVFLSELPRTNSGKVHRAALPVWDFSRPETDTPFEAPRGAVETEIAGLWTDALSVRPIGVHDNFLDLGGDSLAATRLAVHLQNRFGLVLGLDEILDSSIASVVGKIGRVKSPETP
jgi:amino acid adenylation domain-containing protein